MEKRFSDRFLDDLRGAITVLEYARKKYKVEKAGSEWRLGDNHSLKIDPRKNIWGDFGSGNNSGGGVIDFEMFMSGCSFEQAVENIAHTVGMKLPDARKNKKPAPPDDDGPPPMEEPPLSAYAYTNGHDQGGGRATPRTVTVTYDYVDANGGLVYQVCRLEWAEADGKKMKSFGQRRKGPEGEWAWGLDEGLYLRSSRNGEWYVATEKRLESWRSAPRARLEKVPHMLYRLDALREEMAQDPDERRVIFIPEGEKDVGTLERWGLFATTNSGGAKNWHQYFFDEFSGADVVVLLDNDKAGRERGHMIAGSLRLIAKRVRVLSWPDHWQGCPEKADVTDWVDHGGGSFEKFCGIIDQLPTWSPARPESSFGAMMFKDLDKSGKELSWLVKGVLTEGEVSIWYGQWGSGKSFLITDCAMAIARAAGIRWMGNIVKPGLVIYQAGEGALGLRKRLRAYRQHHHLPTDDDLPFVVLTSRIDIFNNENDTDRLILEIKAWAAYYNEILRLVVIDTLNAATPGADENQSRDIGPVLNRARKIATQTGAHVALVDHTPKDGGTPRGWSGKLGNVDNAIEVSKVGRLQRFELPNGRSVERDVRSWKVAKQKDEADKKTSEFVLERVVLGTDSEGDEVSSCVISPLSAAVTAAAATRDEIPKGWAKINTQNEDLMKTLVKALRKTGRSAPEGIDAPVGEQVVTIAEWQAELLELYVGHEEVTPVLKERLKKRVQRACKHWMDDSPKSPRLIGKHREYVWRTGRKIHRIDEPPMLRSEVVDERPDPVLAPGETMESLFNEFK